MKLKANQFIYIAQGENISICTVIGQYLHCTYVRCGINSRTLPVLISRGFYGVGYDTNSGTRTLFLRQWWHYYFAIICEYIRIKLTNNNLN